MGNPVLLTVAAVIAGAVASVSGFGIGSILTPLLAASMGMRLAVAVVSIPHFVGTGLRLALLREHVDKRVLMSFGVASAAGGLAGACLHVWLRSAILGYVLGCLLVFAGVMGLTGLAERIRFNRAGAWGAGAASGLFGGLVGNQGGIRSAALLAFNIPKESFIATATAIGLLVDIFRMPIYAATQFHEIARVWIAPTIATMGVVAGTLAGKGLLRRIPQPIYQRAVAGIILGLGVWMLLHQAA